MSKNKDFIVFGKPDIQQKEIENVLDSLQTGWLGTGPKVRQFESDFADYKGVSANRVAALNSCTAALHTALLAAGVQHGDEVITTPMTFCATINAIIHTGATPILADIECDTFNIDPKEIERKVTPKTKAILPVHFAGRPCDMEAIMRIAGQHNLKVIEDCAHAVESEYKNQKTGTIGDFGCFSFYVTKNITTGEGGMVIAKEEKDIELIKCLSLHGISKDAWKRFSDEGYKHYHVERAGFKYNMMDIQAAIGIHQLERIENSLQVRNSIWDKYQKAFKSIKARCPKEPELNTRHAYHLYTLLVEEGFSRDACLERFIEKGIGVGVHYLSIADQPYYQKTFGWKPKDYPNAEDVGKRTISLPISTALSKIEVDQIISATLEILS